MSNLNSVFDTLRGWPHGSALENSFKPDPNVASIAECVITKTENRQLAAAAVLRIVDDSLVTAPTLTAGDAGKSYMVAGAGGVWSVFAIGDIVEWDGTDWNLVLAGVTGEPPDGTRAVVIETGAAGSFAGGEEKVWSYATGTSTWTAANVPVNGNRILIDGTNGVYDGKYYDYVGTHATGAWTLATKQVPAPVVVGKLTSGALASAPKDEAWIVIQGNDQWDARFVDKVTCLKLRSGCTIKLQHASANSLVAGVKVQANAGVLEAYSTKWPIGVVVWSNGVAGAGGQIAVATY